MKNSKGKTISYCVSIAILLASLIVMICDWAIPLNLWTHPILNFFAVLFFGFSILCLVLGILKKSPWYFFLFATLISLVAFYVIIQYVVWWIALIVALVDCLIIALLSLIVAGNRTENIALNNDPEYKDYKTRKAEKEAMEQNAEPEKLPEIKSFK